MIYTKTIQMLFTLNYPLQRNQQNSRNHLKTRLSKRMRQLLWNARWASLMHRSSGLRMARRLSLMTTLTSLWISTAISWSSQTLPSRINPSTAVCAETSAPSVLSQWKVGWSSIIFLSQSRGAFAFQLYRSKVPSMQSDQEIHCPFFCKKGSHWQHNS